MSLFGTTFFLWAIYFSELQAFDKKKKNPRLSLFKSFWSLLDFDFGSCVHFFYCLNK